MGWIDFENDRYMRTLPKSYMRWGPRRQIEVDVEKQLVLKYLEERALLKAVLLLDGQ